MDPDATARQMLEAFAEEDFELAIELSSALMKWLRVAGFPPAITILINGESLELTSEQANRSVAYASANEVLLRATSLSKSR